MRTQLAGIAVLFAALVEPVAAQLATGTTADLRGAVNGPGTGRIRVTVWHNDMGKRALEPIAEGFADDAGRFAFDRVPWFARHQWGSHSVVVVARRDGHAGLVTLRGDDAPIGAIAVTLGATIAIRGTVRGADGKPLAGVRVWPAIFGENRKAPAYAWVTEPLLPWLAETDADGTFTLRDLPPLAPFKLRANHPDHATAWIEAPDPARPVAASLEAGGRIRGVVRLPDGKPAVRVLVAAASVGIGYGNALSDEQGNFEMTGLPPDTYKVWAEAPDLTVIAAKGIAVRGGATSDAATVQLTPGGFIVGRIVDAATGKPFAPGPMTDVAMYGPARPDGGACECTPVLPDGTFRIRAPAGVNRIYLRAAGDGYSEPTENVQVRDGEETQVEWKLTRGPRRAR